MTEANDRILDKIRKLLAMANDERGNEQERENALRQATNMMAKHQLEMADIPQAQRDTDDPLGRFDSEGWYITWTNMIRGSIARLFDCKYLMGGKINATRGRHIWVGRASNATTAMLMSDWIVKEALREADKHAGHRLTPAGRSFGLGVAMRLAERVTAIISESNAEIKESTGRDLVVIRADHNKENDDFIEATMVTSKARSLSMKGVSRDSMSAGRSHADKVNLSKQVSSVSDPRRIK